MSVLSQVYGADNPEFRRLLRASEDATFAPLGGMYELEEELAEAADNALHRGGQTRKDVRRGEQRYAKLQRFNTNFLCPNRK